MFSPLIVFQLIFSMLMMAGAVFQIELVRFVFYSHNISYFLFTSQLTKFMKTYLFQRFKEIDLEITIIFMGFLMGLSNLFLYCYFGKLATDSYKEMADSLYEVNWHELPIELQKYFVLMIANTQKPLYYHGFGVATLNLETFCLVSMA